MAITTYQNFDLLITRSGDDYRAFVVDAPGGDADSVFALPFTADELDFLGNLAGVRRGGSGGGVAGSASDLKELGGLLYGAVIQGKVASVLATSLEKAEQDNVGLRLRLRFSEETSELATLPWEILYDPVQERFLALSESSPILRYLSLPKARPTLLVKPPLRLLTVLASPPGYEELDLEREWQVLETALAGLIESGKFVLERLEHPTFAALQERLLGEDVHILHFVGHGVYDEASGRGELVLADGEGAAQEVSGEELATLLHNHRSLRLVYLNACQGALSSHLTVFSGVAQTLVQQGVPAAVAMQAEITDTAAIDLSRLFYSALAAGYPVDAALTQARVAIAARSAEWAIPVLFSRSPDNRLFDIRAVLPTPDCPYPGMKPFNEEQKEFFFGRDKAIDDAVNRLAKHPFLAVVGPSGSGKSSLVYAGILPALRASRRFGPGPWTVHTLRPSDARTADGKAAPMQAIRELLHQTDSVTASTPQSPISTLQSPTLLFIDQFEETFTLADAAERTAFLDAVHALIGQPNLHILLTVRADFYAEMMAMGDLWADVQARRLELTPLGEDELWAAIMEPAARVGVEVEDALVTALIADARGEAGVLPLVQETLVRLWDKVEGRQLKRSAYRQMADGGRSGIQVAINDHANDIYHTLPAADRSIARRIFLRLIQFGEGRSDTRRQQNVAELRAGGDDPVHFDETLRALVDGRLLTSSGKEGEPNRRVDISHEALIGGWSLMQGWISEKRVAESTRRRLEDKVTEWLRLNKIGGLLDEYEVLEAELWLQSDYRDELGYSKGLISLLNASKNVLVHLKAEKAEVEQSRSAHRADKLASQATAELWIRRDPYGSLALLLARTSVLATWHKHKSVTDAAYYALNRSVWEVPNGRKDLVLPTFKGHSQGVWYAAFSPDGSRIITASLDGSAKIWDFGSGRELGALHGHTGGVLYAAFSTNGQWVATSSQDGTVRVWDANDSREMLVLPPLDPLHSEVSLVQDSRYTGIWTVNFGMDGQQIVAPAGSSIAKVWDVRARREIWTLSGHSDFVTSAVFSPDSKRIVTSSMDYTAKIWDATDRTLLFTLNGHEGPIPYASFNPAGDCIVTASWDNTAKVWDAHNGRELFTLSGHTNFVSFANFSPDGRRIVTASWDNTAKIWDANNGYLHVTLIRHSGGLNSAVYSPSGKFILTSDANGVVQAWYDLEPLLDLALSMVTREPPELTVEEQIRYGIND